MIKKLLLPTFTVAASLTLAACGQSGGSGSTTKMTNVEVVDGTISDDMILLDTSAGDGTAVDTTATGDLYETVDNRPKASSSDAPKAEEKKATEPEAKAEPKAEPAEKAAADSGE